MRCRAVASARGLASSVSRARSGVELVSLVGSREVVRRAERFGTWTSRWWHARAEAVRVLCGGCGLLGLPLAWLAGFWLPGRYGLLQQSLGRWLWDGAK